MLFRSCSLHWLQTLSLQIRCLVLREAQRPAQDHTAHFCPHTLWSSCILDPVTIQRVCLSLVNACVRVCPLIHSLTRPTARGHSGPASGPAVWDGEIRLRTRRGMEMTEPGPQLGTLGTGRDVADMPSQGHLSGLSDNKDS